MSGQSAEQRALARQAQAPPLLEELRRYLKELNARLSAKSSLVKALRYALGRWESLCLGTTNGRINIDNN
ncbi:IS66 family transposase [Acidocella sp. MX-AZ03]|uniref:IS66 family transposase n=1 Tax=Acidocella sp. MX-AZ03 TaxID=2697363 RepID=UPI003FA4066C